MLQPATLEAVTLDPIPQAAATERVEAPPLAAARRWNLATRLSCCSAATGSCS